MVSYDEYGVPERAVIVPDNLEEPWSTGFWDGMLMVLTFGT
jgi:hypothetical protein